MLNKQDTPRQISFTGKLASVLGQSIAEELVAQAHADIAAGRHRDEKAWEEAGKD